MLTRKALDQCAEEARQELAEAPPDGMLAHLIDEIGKQIGGEWSRYSAAHVAKAYARAMAKNGGPG